MSRTICQTDSSHVLQKCQGIVYLLTKKKNGNKIFLSKNIGGRPFVKTPNFGCLFFNSAFSKVLKMNLACSYSLAFLIIMQTHLIIAGEIAEKKSIALCVMV